MIIQSDDSNIPEVLEYIGEEGKRQCFYLYADLLECGTRGPDFGLWICKDGVEIKGVAYRYYDALHLYSQHVFPIEDALMLIRELNPKNITGPQKSLDQLREQMGDGYKYELSHIVMADHLLKCKSNLNVTLAHEEDIPEIAAIMMDDPIFNPVYTYERLCQQMADRLKMGLGRLFVLRDSSGRVLASTEINVETKELAVIGGTIANEQVRGLGLGIALIAYTWNLVLGEGKRGLSFVSTENTDVVAIDRKLGFKFLGLYARLLRND